jgi:heat shock protein HslJ
MRLTMTLALALLSIAAIRSCSSNRDTKAGNPAAAAQAATLMGTERVLRDLAGAPALEKPEATLGFPEGGHAAGNGSCNRFNGSVTISGTSIKFGPLASTRKACMENGISEQEDRYLKALGAATRYERQGETLLIYFEGSDKPLTFRRAASGKS